MYSRTLRRVLNLATLLTLLLSLFSHNPAQANTTTEQTGPTPEQANRTLYLPLIAADSIPSSDQLIDAALERGEINAETALIYHTFAVFGDTRLPAAYRGDGTIQREITAELAEQYASLSESAKETLAPFLLPPYHVGSWWDMQQAQLQGRATPSATVTRCDVKDESNNPIVDGWAYIDSSAGNVRVWWQTRYPDDAAKAKSVAQEAEVAWAKLAELMGRTPPSDNGSKTPCRGSSDHYDISLADIANPGEAWRHNDNRRATPSYILLKRSSQTGDLYHEMMHAFQYAFPMSADLDEYKWWREATATWAIHYIDPALNFEHGFSPYMLDALQESLESLTAAHQYGAYLFPLFMQMTSGNTSLVPNSFQQFGTNRNSLAVLNALITGGFKEQWPKFALRLLNRPPMNDFATSDQLYALGTFKLDTAAKLNGATDHSYELDGNVKHLASHHYRFTFSDANVRSVAFVNPLFENPQETARIQALVKIGGEWQEEDWTNAPLRTFCRDVKAERIEELMVVISNHEWSNRNHKLSFSKPPRLNITNVACRGWDFEITSALRKDNAGDRVVEDTVAKGRWERVTVSEDPQEGRVFEFYQARNIQASWEHTGSRADCSGNRSATATLPGASNTAFTVWNYALDPTGRDYTPNRRVYNGFGIDTVVFFATQVTYTCSDGSTSTSHVETLSRWFATETEPTQSVSADGKQITGTFKFIADNRVITYTWKMTALPPE